MPVLAAISCVEPDEISICFDPIDISRFQKENTTAHRDGNTVLILLSLLD